MYAYCCARPASRRALFWTTYGAPDQVSTTTSHSPPPSASRPPSAVRSPVSAVTPAGAGVRPRFSTVT
jgi:hypothetical protein